MSNQDDLREAFRSLVARNPPGIYATCLTDREFFVGVADMGVVLRADERIRAVALGTQRSGTRIYALVATDTRLGHFRYHPTTSRHDAAEWITYSASNSNLKATSRTSLRVGGNRQASGQVEVSDGRRQYDKWNDVFPTSAATAIAQAVNGQDHPLDRRLDRAPLLYAGSAKVMVGWSALPGRTTDDVNLPGRINDKLWVTLSSEGDVLSLAKKDFTMTGAPLGNLPITDVQLQAGRKGALLRFPRDHPEAAILIDDRLAILLQDRLSLLTAEEVASADEGSVKHVGTVRERLAQAEKLLQNGVISNAEYEQVRANILDSL